LLPSHSLHYPDLEVFESFDLNPEINSSLLARETINGIAADSDDDGYHVESSDEVLLVVSFAFRILASIPIYRSILTYNKGIPCPDALDLDKDGNRRCKFQPTSMSDTLLGKAWPSKTSSPLVEY
jgi:hypothetical protein